MLEELDPGFDMLRNCNLNDALHRDVATFVTGHITAKQTGPAKAHILGKSAPFAEEINAEVSEEAKIPVEAN